MADQLAPPQNLREIEIRKCGNCRHWIWRVIGWHCERDPRTAVDDWHDEYPDKHICDLWNPWPKEEETDTASAREEA